MKQSQPSLYLLQSLLLRGDHPVLCVLPHVLVDVDVVHLGVSPSRHQLHTAAALLHTEINAEGEVQRLQGTPALQSRLLRVHHQLPQALVDDGVEECEIVEPDGSAQDKLRKKD